MKHFLPIFFLFTLLVASINFCWMHFMPLDKHIPHAWIIFGFFVIITAGFHFLTISASKGKPQAFIRFYMGSTGLRLMLYMMVIIVYRFYDKPTLIPFALGFMAHYFLFTIFEVPVLLKELKKA